jgi:hypothetical protein
MTTRPVTDVVRYRAESHPEFRHGPTASVRQLREFTALPPASTRARWPWPANARRPCLGGATTPPPGRSRLARLRTGGYTYTLEPGVYGEHTADEFWFDRKKAFASTSPRPSWC